ncbi:MAG: hypothetical protein WCT04_20145 [Planctomycetota bacterium]
MAKNATTKKSSAAVVSKAFDKKSDDIIAAIKRLKAALTELRAVDPDSAAELRLRVRLGEHVNEYLALWKERKLRGAVRSLSRHAYMQEQELSLHGRLAQRTPEEWQRWIDENLSWREVSRLLLIRPPESSPIDDDPLA